MSAVAYIEPIRTVRIGADEVAVSVITMGSGDRLVRLTISTPGGERLSARMTRGTLVLVRRGLETAASLAWTVDGDRELPTSPPPRLRPPTRSADGVRYVPGRPDLRNRFASPPESSR